VWERAGAEVASEATSGATVLSLPIQITEAGVGANAATEKVAANRSSSFTPDGYYYYG